MQKGTMITGIVDAVVYITGVFARVAKKSKEEGLFTEKENAYIATIFNGMLKEGNQYIEKVKELLSPKHSMSEEDKLKLLNQMYEAMKGYEISAKKFEKAFAQLSGERCQKLTDLREVQRLFKSKPADQSQIGRAHV